MSYAQFLGIFLIVPLAVLALILRHRLLNRRFLIISGILLGIALIYMAPWDHTAAVWGIWTWAPGRTWGIRLWDVPPEEYLFCLLEALLALVLVWAVMTHPRRASTDAAPGEDRAEHGA